MIKILESGKPYRSGLLDQNKDHIIPLEAILSPLISKSDLKKMSHSATL